jgi:hypothetical protein
VLIPLNQESSTYSNADKNLVDTDFSYCKIDGSQVFENCDYKIAIDSIEEKHIYIHSTCDYKIKINNFDPEN